MLSSLGKQIQRVSKYAVFHQEEAKRLERLATSLGEQRHVLRTLRQQADQWAGSDSQLASNVASSDAEAFLSKVTDASTRILSQNLNSGISTEMMSLTFNVLFGRVADWSADAEMSSEQVLFSGLFVKLKANRQRIDSFEMFVLSLGFRSAVEESVNTKLSYCLNLEGNGTQQESLSDTFGTVFQFQTPLKCLWSEFLAGYLSEDGSFKVEVNISKD